MNTESDDLPTLDPPGTIVVLGTTAVGIEAALYGRFLGYDVTLIAAQDVWAPRPNTSSASDRIGPTFQNDWFAQHWLGEQSIAHRWNDPMPMLPDQCLSSLACSALTAQQEGDAMVLPITIQQWIEDGLQAVLETDLLRGRCFPDTFLELAEQVPVIADNSEEDDAEEDLEVPPDFLLSLSGAPINESGDNSLRCECLIVADLTIAKERFAFDLSADYFHQITSENSINAADELRSGWQQIAKIYACLAGRDDLDLYRPRRV
jgi:hypothetical protein